MRAIRHFKTFLNWVKDHDEEPTDVDLVEQRDPGTTDQSADCGWNNSQLYSMLAMTGTEHALQTVNKLNSDMDARGGRACHRLTRDVAGKSGARLAKLPKRVRWPNMTTHYKEGMEVLARWEQDLNELIELEGTRFAWACEDRGVEVHRSHSHDARHGGTRSRLKIS